MSYKKVHTFSTAHNKIAKLPEVPSQVADSSGPILWYRQSDSKSDWEVKIINSNVLAVPCDGEYEIIYFKELKYTEYFCQECDGYFKIHEDDRKMEDMGRGFYTSKLYCPYCGSQNCMPTYAIFRMLKGE